MAAEFFKDPKIKAFLIIIGTGILVYLAMGSWINKIEFTQKRIHSYWLVLKQNINNRDQILPRFYQLIQLYAPQAQDIQNALNHAYEEATGLQFTEQALTNDKMMQQFNKTQTDIVSALSLMQAQAIHYPLLAQNRQYLMTNKELQTIEHLIAVNADALNTEIRYFNGLVTGIPQKWVNSIYPHEIPKLEVIIKTTTKASEQKP